MFRSLSLSVYQSFIDYNTVLWQICLIAIASNKSSFFTVKLLNIVRFQCIIKTVQKHLSLFSIEIGVHKYSNQPCEWNVINLAYLTYDIFTRVLTCKKTFGFS